MDANDDQNEIAARIDLACSQVSNEIDDILRGGPYTVPFGSPYPAAIIDIAAYMAGVRLYEPKGTDDTNAVSGKPQHRLHLQYERAMARLNAIKIGQIELNVTRVGSREFFVDNYDYDRESSTELPDASLNTQEAI